jgi:hypothetical protein
MMIILRIREKGHYLEIPGITPFRSPADVDISRVNPSMVISHLKQNGMENFEIISETATGEKKIYKADDFKNMKEEKPKKSNKIDKLEKRFGRLENLITKLIERGLGNSTDNSEQINRKLDSLEELIIQKQPSVIIKKGEKGEPQVEDLDTFIPNIDIDSFKVKGKEAEKSVKQDKSDIDENADLLSQISKPKWRK